METQNDVLVGVLAAMQNPPGIEDFAGAIPPDEALIHIVSAAYGELADALEDGPLAGSLERILKGWTDVLHRTIEGLEKQADRAELDMKEAALAQDYSEVKQTDFARCKTRWRRCR